MYSIEQTISTSTIVMQVKYQFDKKKFAARQVGYITRTVGLDMTLL
jgi:hypothetical protein